MKVCEIRGRRVWVTRDSRTSDYVLWSRKPTAQCEKLRCEKPILYWGWRFDTPEQTGRYILVEVCPEKIKRWLGVDPKLPGGPESIRRATLYCKLELDDE